MQRAETRAAAVELVAADRVDGSATATESPQSPSETTSTFAAFQMPVYRTIWLGTILSFVAFNMGGPAQGVVAFDLTGSNSAVGFVAFGQGLAMFFLNPFSGAIADRFSKRAVILGCQILAFSAMLAIGILIRTHQITVPFLVLGAFVIGTNYSFNGPARNALLGEFIPGDRLGNAIAMIQVGSNFSRTAAPFLAGALLSWPVLGAAGTYFVMAAIMLSVIVTMYQIPPTKARKNNTTSMMEDVRAGFAHVAHNRRLLHSILSFHLVAAAGLSYIALVPGFSKQTLGAGTAGVGILLGAAAAGGILTSLFVASKADSRQAPFLLSGASLLLGISLIFTGLAPNLPVAILTMAMVGGGSSAFQTLNNVVALRRSTRDFFGRVMAIMFIAWGLSNLAGLPLGILADAFGERTVLMGMGTVMTISTVFFAIWDRRIAASEPAAMTA